MAASVKIEFDDGSRVISQTLEDAAGAGDSSAGTGAILSRDTRSASFSIDDFYEISKTTAFIANGNFRRVALQFPDPLLREAPEVLWTLQARLRKRAAGAARLEGKDEGGVGDKPLAAGGAAAAAAGGEPPLIFVTGDTSYGSCCVDEVSAQHLKADAIVHYGRACLSPTNSSVPVLYVFGRGSIDVDHLASVLLTGPLAATTTAATSGPSSLRQVKASSSSATTKSSTGEGSKGDGAAAAAAADPPVLLLYDVTYAHAIPALLERLAEGGATQEAGGLVVGFPTPKAYSPLGSRGSSAAAVDAGAGCGCGAASESSRGDQQQQQRLPACGQRGKGAACASGGGAAAPPAGGNGPGRCCGGGGGAGGEGEEGRTQTSSPAINENCATEGGGPEASDRKSCASATSTAAAAEGKPGRRVRIGGLGVELESEEELRRHTLVFVGGEGRQLSNVLMRCAGCVDRVRYDPSLPAGERVIGDTRKGNKDLMRRYYLVQRAREAGVIGIVVGTLGVERYGSVVRSVRKMVEDAGRKAYTLAVGKVNVAKLANFAEVDVFCLVACAENSLLNSREFHAPVVTPLELEVALGRREWDGFYSTDFEDLLGLRSEPSPSTSPPPPPPPSADAAVRGTATAASSGGGAVEGDGGASSAIESLTLGSAPSSTPTAGDTRKADAHGEEEEDDEPFFSLVTGTYQSKPGVSRRRQGGVVAGGGGAGSGCSIDAAAGGGALVGIGDRSLVEWSSPAADFLGKREYQGLEALVGQTEAKAATEGQSGIASDYSGV